LKDAEPLKRKVLAETFTLCVVNISESIQAIHMSRSFSFGSAVCGWCHRDFSQCMRVPCEQRVSAPPFPAEMRGPFAHPCPVMGAHQGAGIAVKVACGEDVRRFHLAPGAGFETLRDLITSFSLCRERIALKYMDDENEWCSLSTDQDLSEAINISKRQTPPILRIQILHGSDRGARANSGNMPAPLLSEGTFERPWIEKREAQMRAGVLRDVLGRMTKGQLCEEAENHGIPRQTIISFIDDEMEKAEFIGRIHVEMARLAFG
jgi:hypothetical protein